MLSVIFFISYLLRVQVLLDAAVMEMQQYSSVVARANVTTTTSTAPQQETPATAPPEAASAVPPEPTLTEPDTATTIGASNNPDSGDISKASSEPEPGATNTTTVQASDRAVTSSEGEKEQEQEVSVQARPPSETGARPKTTDRGSPSDDQVTFLEEFYLYLLFFLGGNQEAKVGCI